MSKVKTSKKAAASKKSTQSIAKFRRRPMADWHDVAKLKGEANMGVPVAELMEKYGIKSATTVYSIINGKLRADVGAATYDKKNRKWKFGDAKPEPKAAKAEVKAAPAPKKKTTAKRKRKTKTSSKAEAKAA